MYIERAKAIKALTGWETDPTDEDIEYVLTKEVPAADVVEVVRCGQCKWWSDDRCQNTNGAHSLVFNPKWFCGSGERREA